MNNNKQSQEASGSKHDAFKFLLSFAGGTLLGKTLSTMSPSKTEVVNITIPTPSVYPESIILDSRVRCAIAHSVVNKLMDEDRGIPRSLFNTSENSPADYLMKLLNYFSMHIDAALYRSLDIENVNTKRFMINGALNKMFNGASRSRSEFATDPAACFTFSQGLAGIDLELEHWSRRTWSNTRKTRTVRSLVSDVAFNILNERHDTFMFSFFAPLVKVGDDYSSDWTYNKMILDEKMDEILGGTALYSPYFQQAADILSEVISNCKITVCVNESTKLFSCGLRYNNEVPVTDFADYNNISTIITNFINRTI